MYDRPQFLVPRGLEAFQALRFAGYGSEPPRQPGSAFGGEESPAEEAVRSFQFRHPRPAFEEVFEGGVEDARLALREAEFDGVGAVGIQRIFST